jgi:peptide/nickel transport system permease protein
MWGYTLRRLLYAVPVLLGVSMLVFALIQLAPGDVVDILVPPEVEGNRRRFAPTFRLDEPVYVQYVVWLSRLLVGDFGISFFTNRPVAEELFGALGNTLCSPCRRRCWAFCSGCCSALAATITTPGSTSCSPPPRSSASACRIIGSASCWLLIFAVVLNMLPAQGMGFEGIPTSWEHVQHLILPVVTLSLIPMGVISRLVRANVLEILSQEFVGTLHAKGLMNRRVLYHTLKNAAPSALALMGLQFGYLLGGSISSRRYSTGQVRRVDEPRHLPPRCPGLRDDRRARHHLRRHQYPSRRAAGADRPAHAAVGRSQWPMLPLPARRSRYGPQARTAGQELLAARLGATARHR